jgi:AraC-like DNA-binding protein
MTEHRSQGAKRSPHRSVEPNGETLALLRLPMPATYFRIVLRELGTTAARRARLLIDTGLTDGPLGDPSLEITLGQQLTLMRNATRLGDPGWTLDVGRRFDLGAQGPLGFAMISAATLGAALDVMVKYGHVRSPWFRVRVERDRGVWGFVVQRQIHLDAAMDIAMLEVLMLSAQALVEAVLGRPMREARITLDYAKPAWAERYRDAFHCAVAFGTRTLGMRMPLDWLELSCPLADTAMFDLSIGRLETERRRIESGEHLSARVEVLFAGAGDAGLSLPQLAERLNLSRRTLIRRLAAAGTTFGELLDAHRMERAQTLLGDPRFPVSEIAYRVGYSDPANFTRAFRRWCDESPAEFRARRRG